VGVALRPTFTTLVCQCLGGRRDAAIIAGAAIELYHNSTLVHDDIIDKDDLRRGKPSVHYKYSQIGKKELPLLGYDNANHYGLTMAILAGDMLQSWSAYLLSLLPNYGVSDGVSLELIRTLFGKCSPVILAGETLDVELPFMEMEDVTPEMLTKVLEDKTAELFRFAAFAGGILAKGKMTDEVEYAMQFAFDSGIAFQIKDDILGIMGDEEVLGKPVGSDIVEGKRTYILKYALENSSEEQQMFLLNHLGKEAINAAEMKQIQDIFVLSGAIEAGEELAAKYINSAENAVNNLPDNEYRTLLSELNEIMVNRVK